MKITIAVVMGALLLGSPVLSIACKKGEHEKADASSKSDTKKQEKTQKS